MLDVRLLRTDPDGVRASLARRSDPEVLVQLDEAIAFDGRLRDLTAERDATRARVNELSKQVGALRREGRTDDAEVLQVESRSLGEAEKVLAGEHDELSGALRDLLLRIPNLIHPDVPDAGHMAPLTRPDLINPLVRTFLCTRGAAGVNKITSRPDSAV